MIIAGNWKMNLVREEAIELARHLDRWHEGGFSGEMIIFPAAVLIHPIMSALGKKSNLQVGGQDCHTESEGAHTGDIAAAMLADAGCRHVLLGHSERRLNHSENSEMVAAKAGAAHACGLRVMICVGESLAERQSDRAFDIVSCQIKESLPDGFDSNSFTIAYEPVWAIGTGKVATEKEIAAMHEHIRSELTDQGHADVPILYGGSVKPDNAAAILGIEDVGGVLVGGASLRAEDFIAIAEAC
jgi:triosephosphate isomerase